MASKTISLLVTTQNEWSRRVLMGVAQYGLEVGPWHYILPDPDKKGDVYLPPHWEGDGIICRLTTDRLRDQALRAGVPVVNTSWRGMHDPDVCHVVSDTAGCGQIVAEYFLERNFQHFGYVGPSPRLKYDTSVPDSIEATLKPKQRTLARFPFPPVPISDPRFLQRMKRWLVELPQPLALVCWSSHLGRVVTVACEELGFAIPCSVSIVCVEHDDLASMLSPIPLSGVDQDPWRVGYTAAAMLDRMMAGQSPPERLVRVPPLSIVERQSSEASAIEDEIVRKACQLISRTVGDGVNVDDIVRELKVGRRTLEVKFQQHLGVSPSHFIRQTRLVMVKRLLRETSLSLLQIAEQSGYRCADSLNRAFKQETGITPIQFRSGNR